jgi:crossover junction endodeoxyribonuclease RuvC
MNILALDPAYSTTGYAVLQIEDKKLIEINKITTDSKYDDDTRIEDILNVLYPIIKKYNINVIALENGYVGKNGKTSLQLSYLRGFMVSSFRSNKILTSKQLPSSIRKAIGLKGNAKKEEVANQLSIIYKDDPIFKTIGPYSDKQNKIRQVICMML